MLLVSTLQQFDIELADFLTILAALGLLLFLIPATLSTPLLAAVTESITSKKHKSFYGKCARQISQVTYGIGLMLFTILGTGTTIILLQFQPEFMQPPLLWRTLTGMAIPLTALLLLTLYLTTWSSLKKQRGLHLFLGYLAGTAGFIVLLLLFLFLGSLQQPIVLEFLWTKPLEVLGTLLTSFFSSPVLWLLALYILCTGLAAGTGLSQLWLIMRRYKEDYGRDYYNFAMHYCARLAMIFVLLATAVAGLIFWQVSSSFPSEFLQRQDRGVLLVAFGLPISCCILWLCIVKSDTPMRHKPGAFFACLFLYLALCAQLLFYLSTFPMM